MADLLQLVCLLLEDAFVLLQRRASLQTRRSFEHPVLGAAKTQRCCRWSSTHGRAVEEVGCSLLLFLLNNHWTFIVSHGAHWRILAHQHEA